MSGPPFSLRTLVGLVMTRTVKLIALLVAFASVSPIGAQTSLSSPRRPVHTFSIVARDPATGERRRGPIALVRIGPLVPWVEAGVGAIATQLSSIRAMGS